MSELKVKGQLTEQERIQGATLYAQWASDTGCSLAVKADSWDLFIGLLNHVYEQGYQAAHEDGEMNFEKCYGDED